MKKHSIRTADGSWLEVKQGEVQDREGHRIAESPDEPGRHAGFSASAKIPGGLLVGAALALFAPLLVFAGFALFAVIALVLTVVWGASALLGGHSRVHFVRKGK